MVAAVIFNADRSGVLLSLRAAHQDQGNLWEFPGGKLEVNESRERALVRELREELGIVAREYRPLMQVTHKYTGGSQRDPGTGNAVPAGDSGADKTVLLDVWEVFSFTGNPTGRERQIIRWVDLDELPTYEFPAANSPVVERLLSTEDIRPINSPSGSA